MASIDSLQFRSLYNLQSSIGRPELRIPPSVAVFRRRPEVLNWIQLETSRRFVCKAIGDSSTPDEEIQIAQNDDKAVVAVRTHSNVSNDSDQFLDFGV